MARGGPRRRAPRGAQLGTVPSPSNLLHLWQGAEALPTRQEVYRRKAAASKPCSARGAAHGKETPGAARQPPRGDAQPSRLGSPRHVPGETRSRHMQAPAQRLNGDEKARRLLPENKEAAAAELGVGKTLRCPRGSLRRQQDADGLHRSYSPPRAHRGTRSPGGGRTEGGPAPVPSPRTCGVGSAAGRKPGPGQQLATRGKFLRAGFASSNAVSFHLGVTTAVCRRSRGESAASTTRASFMARRICGVQHRAHSRVDLVVVVTPG